MRLNERLVTLHDGRQVSNYSEDWRHECEAVAILNMPHLAQRRAHLYGVRESVKINGQWIMKQAQKGILQHRGQEEVARLEKTMTAIWERRKAMNDNILRARAAGEW